MLNQMSFEVRVVGGSVLLLVLLQHHCIDVSKEAVAGGGIPTAMPPPCGRCSSSPAFAQSRRSTCCSCGCEGAFLITPRRSQGWWMMRVYTLVLRQRILDPFLVVSTISIRKSKEQMINGKRDRYISEVTDIRSPTSRESPKVFNAARV
ncbi:hypothetical protein BJY00DRAFT_116433 [Aspergillus carlsbadensis]|nr:hypothetical protein BJY00DRAFT_116433 [Aspergillus carlsbadensis]